MCTGADQICCDLAEAGFYLVGLYEADKDREEHGRLSGLGVLSKVLYHRAVRLLVAAGGRRPTGERNRCVNNRAAVTHNTKR